MNSPEKSSASYRERWTRAWPTTRALAIVVVVAMNLLQGLPMLRASAAYFEAPVGRREVNAWATRLQSWGFDWTAEELAQRTVEVSDAIGRTHQDLVRPVWPYFHYTHTQQSWALFSAADPFPPWMHIEVRFAEGWTLYYRPLHQSAELPLELQGRAPVGLDDASLLEYRRIRALWNPGTRGPRAEYGAFVDWAAARIFEQHPDALECRVRYMTFQLEVPGRPGNESFEWQYEERRTP